MDSTARYGAPPPPPVPGSIPSQRLQTQIPAAAPACVQNAMMTKDKKPFTYTPGGIDLSEIKSPRMAKRIARNAQYEGVTGTPKPSPLAAQQNVPHQSPPAMGAAALGMPFQVFPTGPPPPPPIPSSAMPPPPPPQPMKLAPQSNGVDASRKSPAPQNLEPPPFGCRPEIKIPENPMSTLKKVPRPREKNDFWIQEYRKERSASPMVGESGNVPVAYQQQPEYQQPEYQRPEVPLYQPQQHQSPVQTPQQVPSSPPFRQPEPEQQQRSIPVQYQPPYQTQESVHQQQRSLSPIKTIQQQQQQQPAYAKTPSQGVSSPTPQQQYQQQLQQQQQQQKNAQVGSLYIPPVAPENLAANQQQEQQKQQQSRQTPVSSPPTPRWMAQKPNSREMPEWVRDENTASPPTLQRTPSIQQQSAPNSASPAGPGMQLKFQLNSPASNSKERVIPIQMEQTPTPTRTPATPGFGPQPFYNVNQQFSSVPSPGSGSGYSSPSSGFNTPSHPMRNPNQFVDQGYNNYPNQWPAQHQQRVISPQQQQQQQSPQPSGTRIIPIAIEGQDSPFNPDVVRGPVSHSPMVIQNGNYNLIVHDCPVEAEIRYRKSRLSDPRTLQHQNSWSNGTIPNQSKSFKILQKITDTVEGQDINDGGEHPPAQVHRQYSRPLSVTGDSPTEQMRRMQLNDQDQAFMNRVKNQVPMQRPQPPRYVQQRPVFQHEGQAQPYVHPSEQQVPEPKKYTGSAIPSRSFKILQAMTTPENAGPGQSDL